MKIEFRVEGEARFLSHHDMMRCMELAAARAKTPVRFSEGFNPRPKMSLPLPRPVGTAGLAEVLVIELTEAVDNARITERLTAETPDGITVSRCEVLAGRKSLQATVVAYDAAVEAADADPLAARVEHLNQQAHWPYFRRGRKGKPDHQLDLRTLICDLNFDGAVLHFTLTPDGQIWARPGEVLDLLELDTPAMRASVVRTAIRWTTGDGDLATTSAPKD